MSLQQIAIARLRQQMQQADRPEEYFDDLLGCAARMDEQFLWVDVDGDCYRELVRYYRSGVSRGVGDTIKKVLDATGIGLVATAVVQKATGRPCGCGRRQRQLNALLPYRRRKKA